MPVFREAVVICTRNRADDLRRTLESIAQRETRPLVVVVDASDAATAEANRAGLHRLLAEAARHFSYPHAPSSARQRNYGLERLPASVEVVHFLDDDVTLHPGYFRALTGALRAHPRLGGVGAWMTEPGATAAPPAPWQRTLRRLFLLDGLEPSRVLLSGRTTPAPPARTQTRAAAGTTPGTTPESLVPADWLNGVSSYRRAALRGVRFDASLPGYAMLEDLDFSFRVGRAWDLAVVPEARLVHRASLQNRHGSARRTRTALLHRRWFVEKNRPHPLSGAAFWWATLGQALALLASRRAGRRDALRGWAQGVRAILRREPPLS